MHYLIEILKSDENRLMKRILDYAQRFDYARYTSTLEEAWRMSIAGLNESIEKAWGFYARVPEFGPDDDFRADPAAEFGVVEAQRHRQRGVSLCMFLSFFKYYRQAYSDHVKEAGLPPEKEEAALYFLTRVFDRMEIAFCDEWSGLNARHALLELQAANRYMTNEKNSYLTVFESVSNPIILLDGNGLIANLNHHAAQLIDPGVQPGHTYYSTSGMRQFAAMQGAGSAESGQPIDVRFVGDRPEMHFPWITGHPDFSAVATKEHVSFEVEFAATGAPIRSYQVQISKMLDISGKFPGTLIILNDITERRAMLEHLNYLATTDPLTQACNRRHFFDMAQREFQRAQRYGRDLALIELDIDHFKEINDACGHHVGDEVLVLLVKTLNSVLRTSDTLGRLGGEEFAVVLPETTPDAARDTAERVLRSIAQLVHSTEKGPLRFSVSIGVSGIKPGENGIEDMLKRADAAMYEAKNAGRNSVRVST